MEEFAIYRDYFKAYSYLIEQRVNQTVRQHDADDSEGFKTLFPGIPETEEIEEEFDGDFITHEKCYDEPETAAQLAHLEKYGYYYK